tara:strand:+ start:179 stop:649 length:471 start_codon:yes stop_codon:yes gene_type:complete
MTNSKKKQKSVLFICELNVIRSPIAEFYLKSLIKNSAILIDSCGFKISNKDYFTSQVMTEVGINIDKHNPKSISQVQLSNFNFIISFSKEIYDHLMTIVKTKSTKLYLLDVPIPSLIEKSREQKLFLYRKIRDDIITEIKEDNIDFFNKYLDLYSI